MTDRKTIRFERTYDAAVADLWALWTTKQGFEAWWGPEGFRVEVHAIDPRVGGALHYDMIADSPEHIAYMKREGMPTSHATRGTFVEVEPLKRLKIRHVIDFIPGVAAYDNNVGVELVQDGTLVRMIITLDAHPDESWTQRAVAGFESQLTKLPRALAARRR
jgi:uncharacterized protein YndB with AHSA1/START domain